MSNTVSQYYDAWESRLGYRFLLGGTRHFGYYAPGTLWPFPLSVAMREMERRVWSLLNLSRGSLVLDAGCGTGDVALFMAREGLKVEAVDLLERHTSRAKLKVQSEGLREAVHVTRMSFQDLSFDDNMFDGVYAAETLSHSPDLSRALGELYRVLRPGGHLALLEYEHDVLKNDEQSKAISKVCELSSMTTFKRCTYGTVKKELELAGFDHINVEDYSDNVAPMMRFFFLLAWLPYMVLCLFGLQDHFPNATAAVELWRYRDSIRYIAVAAQKP